MMMEHDEGAPGGLPGTLPQGERVLWRGKPDWRRLALTAFHVRSVAIYFGLLLALRGALALSDGASPADAAMAALVLAPLALAGLAILGLLAWLTARATLYTVTTRRLVIRFGVALSMSVNVPFSLVGSAGLRTFRDGSGDIPLKLMGEERISMLLLWPNVRPWRLRSPEPMIRAVPDATSVAATLGKALASFHAPATEAAQGPAPRVVAMPAAQRRPEPVLRSVRA